MHLVKFDFDGGPAAIGATVAAVGAAAEEAGLDNVSVMDHYFQMPIPRWRRPADARGLHDAGLPRRAHLDRRPAAAGHRRHLPAPGPARQDRDHPRRAVRRPGGARPRRRVVPARSTRRWASRSRRSPSGSSGSRRRCRSCARCSTASGRRTTGKHYRLAETVNLPGAGAAAADHGRRRAASGRRCGWSRSTPTPATSSPTRTAGRPRSQQKLDVLRGHCDREGRDYDAIDKTILWSGRLDPSASADFASSMEEFADARRDRGARDAPRRRARGLRPGARPLGGARDPRSVRPRPRA